AIGRYPPREEGAPQPAELFAGTAEQLGRSLIGLADRVERDTPAPGRPRVRPRQFAVGDVRQVVEELLLRQQQEMIGSVPRRRLFDVELDEPVAGHGDVVDGPGFRIPAGSSVTTAPSECWVGTGAIAPVSPRSS